MKAKSNHDKYFESEREFENFENDEQDYQLTIDNVSSAVLWGTDWTTETIHSQMVKGNIDLNPRFQRRDAWSTDKKSRFIESLILGFPVPPIILAESKEVRGRYIVIDGKQRLLAIRRFYAPEIEIKGDFKDFEPLKLSKLDILKNISGKTISEVLSDPETQPYIDYLSNQPIRTSIIRNWHDEDYLYKVFLRLNTGNLRLSPQELRKALHPGEFIYYIDDYSGESEQIRKALRIQHPDYRMRDMELAIRFYAFKLFISEYTGNLKIFLDETVKLLNASWEEDKSKIIKISYSLDSAIETTFSIFGNASFSKYSDDAFQTRFNRAVFDVMTYYFSEKKIARAAISNKQLVKDAFIRLCKESTDFLSSLESGTNNIKPTTTRFRSWGETLNEVLGIKIVLPTMKIK